MFNSKVYEIEINNALATVLNENFTLDSNIKASAVYSLLDGGKRIRPMLFNLLLEAYDIDYKDYQNIACAIEMIHTYSLVHDDLPAMDNDSLRRGKPTTHIRFNEAIAILCGDALLTNAFNIITKTNLQADKLIKIIELVSDKAGANGMIYGQDLDLDQYAQIDYDYLIKTYYYKTSCLLQLSMNAAAIIANKPVNDFEKLGEYLGLAFQIQDDILEVTQSSQTIGKSNESDQLNNKVTIVSLIGLEAATNKVDEYFNEINKIIINNNLENSNFNKLVKSINKRQK